VTFLLVLLLLVPSGASPATPPPEPAFVAGQVWAYNARSKEKASRIRICRVDGDPELGEVVHVRVEGLRLRFSDAPGGEVAIVEHLPFAPDALRRSVTRLESSGPAPDCEAGRAEWLAARATGRGKAWGVTVREALIAMETQLVAPPPAPQPAR
jgi:hypothetical protein